ncbi:hypothetical protein MLD38_009850 [Melastoma candidum]|uniref:Uncharacterized protein n=1 Tax=Melastoma candidum TaxID=119954 RepID=A0ACB9S0C9_9MYRT|nr:hypothetical protein MLD38_009850 [Melastoma candidum]
MDRGVCRWMVDLSTWHPSPHEFSSALSLLPQSEHPSILRFVRMEDRKRALVSRLLQYILVFEVDGIPYRRIVIKRTPEGKPYLECDRNTAKFPSFNFNVSHQGDYVGIASEPVRLVGFDIVSYTKPDNESVEDFLQHFRSHFTSWEWGRILEIGNCEGRLIEFYRYWSLKEAYVKAVGTGVGFGLERLEFHHDGNWNGIYVKIDGKMSRDWRFRMIDLGERHCASVAVGPRSDDETNERVGEHQESVSLEGVDFVWRSVEELVVVLDKAR